MSKLLGQEGYETLVAHDGLEALEVVATDSVQLIIMDIMMPKLDGLSATMKLREKRNIPIIMLSAKSEDSDKILGLSIGADDYVTKPFNSAELVARVRSQLRRYNVLGGDSSLSGAHTALSAPQNVIVIGGLALDIDAKHIVVDGVQMRLTATEYGILELLMTNKNRVFSAEEIYQKVWKELSYSVENTVMVHIRRIREKIEINPKQPKYLKVVWGIGYKIEG